MNNTALQLCELCTAGDKLKNMSARCCQLRFIDAMDQERRIRYIGQVKRTQGEKVGNDLVNELHEFRKKLTQ